MNENAIAIIPCFNAELTISQVVEETRKYIRDVVVIDDGSRDLSGKKAEMSGAKVISFPINRGTGAATKAGFQIAEKMNKELIVTLDADGAHHPGDINELINIHIADKNILTVGNRWKKYNARIPSAKWWANQFACTLINQIAKTNLPDVACGFRVFHRKLIKEILDSFSSEKFDFIYESIFLGKKLGKIGHVPVNVLYDANDLFATKKNELEDLLKVCCDECNDPNLLKSLMELRMQTTQMKKILLRFKSKNKYEYIVLYPLEEKNAYIFQRQHSIFVSDNIFIEI